MPEIIVHLAAGRAADQKRMLLKELTQAVVDSLGVKPEQVIVESPKSLKSRGGIPYDEL